MTLKLTVAEHLLRPGAVCMLHTETGQLIATIYATERGVKIVSKHLHLDQKGTVTIDPDEPAPAIEVNFL